MFQNQIKEIESSPTLRWYGLALALAHVATFFFVYNLPNVLSRIQNPICWSWFSNCQIFRFAEAWPWQILLHGYLALSTLAVCASYLNKIRLGFYVLMACMVMKFIGNLMDYTFMGNYHYMHLLVQIAFLFLPQKKKLIPQLVAFFYIAAGSLKINPEWITGAALTRPLPFGDSNLLMIACILVIFLELFVVFGLFAKNPKLRWVSLACFIIFHVTSYFWVGFFYPVIMLCLISIFALIWYKNDTPERWVNLKKINIFFLCTLVVLQTIPLFGNDPSLFTDRRLWSLNMFDARTQCLNSVILKYDDHNTDYTYDPKNHGIRVQCDPLLYRAQAINLCRQEVTDPNFKDLDLVLLAKRRTDKEYQTITVQRDFCAYEGLRP